MDVKCKFCGEPFDHGELNSSPNLTPAEAFQAFKKHGCGAVDAIFGLDDVDYATDCRRGPIETREGMERINEKWDYSENVDDYNCS